MQLAVMHIDVNDKRQDNNVKCNLSIVNKTVNLYLKLGMANQQRSSLMEGNNLWDVAYFLLSRYHSLLNLNNHNMQSNT